MKSHYVLTISAESEDSYPASTFYIPESAFEDYLLPLYFIATDIVDEWWGSATIPDSVTDDMYQHFDVIIPYSEHGAWNFTIDLYYIDSNHVYHQVNIDWHNLPSLYPELFL
jgi:hypothetical protein